MDWNLKTLIRKCLLKQCVWIKKKKKHLNLWLQIYIFSFVFFLLPLSEWHVKSDKPAVEGGRSTGTVGSETKPRLQHQSRTLWPHPDSSEALCWIMIPQCIATASVLSFPISPVPKAHMETVWSHCVTVYAKSLSSLHRDLGLLRSALLSPSQTALGSRAFI